MLRTLRAILICLLAIWHLNRLDAWAAGDNDPSSDSSQPSETWRIQRVLVPADHPEQWPRDQTQRYFPMQSQEFERRLAQLQGQDGIAAIPTSSELTRAQYSAEWSNGDLVGQATWNFEHSGGAPSVVLLEGCRLPIYSPQWLGSDRRALVGNDQRGRLAAVVDRSGAMRFDWSLRSQSDADGWAFELRLPSCPINTLQLTLPGDVAPSTDAGVVSIQGLSPKGQRQWQIDLGGNCTLTLRITKQVQVQNPPLILVREVLTGNISPQGLEVSSEFQFDAPSQPIRQIALLLDSPLTPLAVQLAGVDQQFSVASTGDKGQNRVTVRLNEPLLGTNGVLRVVSMAPIVLETPWRLPLVHLEGAQWQEGRARLLISTPLLLGELTTHNARQTGLESLGTPASGEAIDVQFLRQSADVLLTLTRQRAQVVLSSGTSVVLRANECSGRYEAAFSSLRGKRFALEADVSPNWIIDSVESDPPELLADWSQGSVSNEGSNLRLQLNTAIPPAGEAHIVVAGRRRRAPEKAGMRVDDLRMLRFTEVIEQRRIVRVQAEETHQLRFSGADELQRVDPAQLPASEAALLGEESKGLVFVDDPRAESLVVGIESLPPQFEADIRAEALVRDDEITESYMFSITPQSRDLVQFTVLFSQPRGGDLRWKLADPEASELTVRRLSPTEHIALGLGEGEAWRITLGVPRSQPYRVMAVRDVPLTAETPLALASVREATSQRGVVHIRSAARWMPEVICRRLKTITPQPPQTGQYGDTLAAYRYNPEEDVLLTAEPPLIVARPGGTPVPAAAWIWRAQLTSRWNTTGLEHLLSCQLESAGREGVEFWMPRGSELRGAWIDDQPAIDSTIVGPAPVRLRIPPGVRFASLVLYWVDEQSPLATVGSYAAPWPRCDVPILGREWTVWIPPGVSLAEATVSGVPAISPRWTSRLFGPLARGSGQGPFNPLSAEAWASLAGSWLISDESQALAERFSARLKSLATSTPPAQATRARTWNELIAEAWLDAAGSSKPGVELLMDHTALAAARINAQTPVVAAGATQSDVVADSIPADELLCLVHPRAVVVTTRQGAARWLWNQSAPRPPAGAAWRTIPPGRVFDRVAAVVAGKPDEDFLTWALWTATRSAFSAPWLAGDPNRLTPSAGWTIARFDCGISGVAHIWVVKQRSIAAWAGGLFALALGARWWMGRRLALLDLGLLSTATAVALIMPAAWAPLSAAVWLGLVGGLLLSGIRWPVHAPVLASTQVAEDSKTHRGIAAAPAGCLLAVLAWQALGYADEIKPTSDVEPAPIDRVFVPVNDGQQPTGGLYYLSESFRDALMAATDIDQRQAPKCLVTQTVYRAQLSRDKDGQPTGGIWHAELALEALVDHAVVELPLGGKGATLVPDGVTLAGRPAPFRWDERSRKMTIDLEKKGSYKLEVSLHPHLRRGAFDFTIPPASGAVLQLVGVGGDSVEIDSSLGTVAKTGPDRWEAQLGPANRIVVRADESKVSSPAFRPAVFGVDELYWLRVRPGGVTVDARFKINVEEGRLQNLRLTADATLLPLSLPAQVANMQVQPLDAKSNRLQLELAKPISGQTTIDVSFLLAGAQVPGELRLPRLDAFGARASRRFWAVTVDPALAYAVIQSAGAKPFSPEQFAAMWLSGATKPDLAIQRIGQAGDWAVSIQPRQSNLTSRYDMAWQFGPNRMVDMRMIAHVTASGTPVFQYRISVPPELQIADVLLHERNVDRAARWWRASPVALSVLLNTPVIGERKLIVRGRITRPDSEQFTLPDLRIDGSQSAGYRAVLLRASDVRVEVADKGTLSTADSQQTAVMLAEVQGNALGTAQEAASEQLVAALQDPGGYQPCVVRIEPNRPDVNLLQVTRLDHGEDGWTATVDAQLEVAKGLLDVLRFELPESWQGPFEIEPAMPSVVEEVPGERRRQLVVRPAVPVEGRLRLRIAGPLHMAAGERPSAPNVQLAGTAHRTLFYLLPRQLNQQQLAWDTRGLAPKPLPDDESHAIDVSAYRSYQLAGEHRRATLRSVERAKPDPHVRSADISLAWQFDGACSGTETFDIEPGGATSCVLNGPESCQFVHVQLDGAPALRRNLGKNNWEIWLGDSTLPRRLDVVWLGQLPDAAATTLELAAPLLEGIPVERTLWTISAPYPVGAGTPQGGSPISPLRSELIRFQSTAALIESATNTLLEESRDEMARWYVPWRDELVARRVSAEHTRASRASSEPNLDAGAEIAAIVQDQARLATRLGVPDASITGPLPDEELPALRATDLWRLTQIPGRSLTYAQEAGAGRLAIYYLDISGDTVWRQIFAAALLIAAGLGAIVSWKRPQFAFTWSQPVAFAGLMALGVAWWLWMTPSDFGLVIVGTVVWLAWRWTRNGKIADIASISPRTSSVIMPRPTVPPGSSHR